MAMDDNTRGRRIAQFRPLPTASENPRNGLPNPAKTDFGRLRASLKLSDAAIGVAVVLVAFCLVYLIGYLFGPFLSRTTWLFLSRLPLVCMIILSVWLSRRRRANLIRRPRIRSILIEAAIAAPLALIAVVLALLLDIGELEDRGRWEWLIRSGDFTSLFFIMVFSVAITPVAEELFYRAFLYNALRSKLPSVIAATAQAGLFAIAHLYGLGNSITLFGYGLYLLGIYLWRRTILTPIFVHAFWNLCVVIGLLAAMVAYANTPHLGVIIDPHEDGCCVTEVVAGSAADRASLHNNDIITSIDSRPVESPEGLISLIQSHGVGDRVAIAIIRDGQQLELEAVLGRRNTSHYTILDHGRDTAPEIAEFKRLFPNFEHETYAGEPECQGDERREFTAGIHGRYVLQMNIDITFGPSGAIASYSKPQFLLLEVSSVSHSGRSTSVRYSDNQRRFGLADWKKVLGSGGDLGVLGIEIEKDRPVAEFKKVFPNNY